jgi:hypothetical protein
MMVWSATDGQGTSVIGHDVRKASSVAPYKERRLCSESSCQSFGHRLANALPFESYRSHQNHGVNEVAGIPYEWPVMSSQRTPVPCHLTLLSSRNQGSVIASPRVSVPDFRTSLLLQDGLVVDVDQRILNKRVSIIWGEQLMRPLSFRKHTMVS